jgi:cobalt-precorrin 5A hydrolase/precorrin-3B C17-methyltransferase
MDEIAAPLKGRPRGTLYVVGIGPGQDAWRSPEVTGMIEAADDLVGYSLYLDLLGALIEGKTRHDFDLGREEVRVRHAMELAGEGRTVALVCSGDAGIYAMATLVYELIARKGVSDAASRIAVINSPGISALQAAAARAGAPLGHDFCTISLSDLLTPWDDIQARVRAAGEGDFVIAFYNPVSRKRRTQLAWARDELMKHRPGDTPVILATNLGRDGETVRIVALSALQVDDVDMLTVVIVGSSDSRVVETGDGRSWVYTPRGYSGKQGTQMEASS